MNLHSKTKKGIQKKLEILKSILDNHPFGFTLMEIYKKFKHVHEIGSRNTLKKYLEILLKKGDIETRIIGNYKIFRSKTPFSAKTLFELYPTFEKFSLNFLLALTKVLDEDLHCKGKLIGKEIAKNFPILESKAIKQFRKFQDFFEILPFQQFLEKMKERTYLELEDNSDLITEEDHAYLIYRDTKFLKEGAWVLYYIIAGFIETHLNEVFYQKVQVNVQSINEEQCTIKIEKERT